MEGLTVGRVVHYVSAAHCGKHLAAIVAHVIDKPRDGEDSLVNLAVFNPDGSVSSRQLVMFNDESGLHPFDTWHWPERA